MFVLLSNGSAFASLSREELIPLVQQQAELNLFLQQESFTLREEIHRLKNGGNLPPLLKTEPPAVGQAQHTTCSRSQDAPQATS